MPHPLSTVLLVIAVTVSAVHDNALLGLLPFLLAFINEAGRMWAARPEPTEVDDLGDSPF